MVTYVDYGNSEEQPIKALQPLYQKFTELPAQAIAVNLHNLASRDNQRLAKDFTALTENNLKLSLICMSVKGEHCISQCLHNLYYSIVL